MHDSALCQPRWPPRRPALLGLAYPLLRISAYSGCCPAGLSGTRPQERSCPLRIHVDPPHHRMSCSPLAIRQPGRARIFTPFARPNARLPPRASSPPYHCTPPSSLYRSRTRRPNCLRMCVPRLLACCVVGYSVGWTLVSAPGARRTCTPAGRLPARLRPCFRPVRGLTPIPERPAQTSVINVPPTLPMTTTRFLLVLLAYSVGLTSAYPDAQPANLLRCRAPGQIRGSPGSWCTSCPHALRCLAPRWPPGFRIP